MLNRQVCDHVHVYSNTHTHIYLYNYISIFYSSDWINSSKIVKCKESESVSYSVVPDSVIPWTVARQAPLSMEFFRKEYWSGLPFPFQGTTLNQGSNLGLLNCKADSLPSEPPGKPNVEAQCEM